MNNYTSASGMSTDKMPTLEQLKEAVEKGKAIRREMLRGMGELAETECQICKRKVTVVSRPWGDALVMCRHIETALRNHTAVSVERQVNPTEIFPSRLYGYSIEVLDDEPRR